MINLHRATSRTSSLFSHNTLISHLVICYTHNHTIKARTGGGGGEEEAEEVWVTGHSNPQGSPWEGTSWFPSLRNLQDGLPHKIWQAFTAGAAVGGRDGGSTSGRSIPGAATRRRR